MCLDNLWGRFRDTERQKTLVTVKSMCGRFRMPALMQRDREGSCTDSVIVTKSSNICNYIADSHFIVALQKYL